MIIKRIVLLPGTAFAQRVTAGGVQEMSARGSLRFDDLRAALADRLDVPVEVQELLHKVEEGDFFICRPDALDDLLDRVGQSREFAQRCLLVGVPRNSALAEAETLGLAAVVDSTVYSQWQIGYPLAEVAIFGRPNLAKLIDGTPSPVPKERGSNYQRIVAMAGTGLPDFIAAYIQALRLNA